MNALGLTMIMKMGCICTRETININGIKYSVLERLGDGGFSTVDLVECKNNKKIYAMKRMTCHSIADQQKVQREIDYLKKIRHPNIMELHDSYFKGSADIVVNTTSEAFLVLPYYPRGTLHDNLQSRAIEKHHMDVTEIFRIFSSVCDAVQYLHEPQPLAHRDLKTANICFTDNFTPVVIDLGSMVEARIQVCGSQDAQKLQDEAAENSSAPYRAPELFNVDSYCVIDERTDIWSLGCILYALCYFMSPFDLVYMRGDSVALAVLSGGVHFPEESKYPDHVHDLIIYMLNTNPAERPFIQSVIEKTQIVMNTVNNIA